MKNTLLHASHLWDNCTQAEHEEMFHTLAFSFLAQVTMMNRWVLYIFPSDKYFVYISISGGQMVDLPHRFIYSKFVYICRSKQVHIFNRMLLYLSNSTFFIRLFWQGLNDHSRILYLSGWKTSCRMLNKWKQVKWGNPKCNTNRHVFQNQPFSKNQHSNKLLLSNL